MTASITQRAVLDAATAAFGTEYQFEVSSDGARGGVALFVVVHVDGTPTSQQSRVPATNRRRVSTSQACAAGLNAEAGDELLLEIFYRPEDTDRRAPQDEITATLGLGLRPTEAQLAAIAHAAQHAYQRFTTTPNDLQEGSAP